MRFAFEVIFVKIYSLAVLLFEREKIGGQAGRKIFSQYERTEGPDKKKKKDYATLFIRYSFSE